MSGGDDMEDARPKIPKPQTAEASVPVDEPLRLWHLIVLIFAVASCFGGYAALGPWAVVLLILVLFAGFMGWVVTTVRGAAGQRYSLLWMLAIAADHKMPLATTVEAFASQFRGVFRRRVLRLAAMLNQGSPLAHALRSVSGLASADANLLIEVGEESGRLGPALRRAASVQASRSMIGQMLASQFSYLLMILLIAQMITIFLMYFIMPKFEAIFMDFGVVLPEPTIVMLKVVSLATRYFMPLWLPLLTLGLLLMIPVALTSGTTFESSIVSRLFPRRHGAAILRSLAICAEAGRPIERGLRTLANHYPVASVRRRLVRVEQDVVQGVDWREALTRGGLIRPTDHDVLISAAAVGNLPWAMNDLAEAIDRRLQLRMAMLSQAVWPIVILAIAGMVLFLAVGFFAPLVTLIGRLSG